MHCFHSDYKDLRHYYDVTQILRPGLTTPQLTGQINGV